ARLPEGAVNEHLCQYKEPQVAESFTFQPSATQAEILGNVELVVNVSPSPLPASEIGVAITAGAGSFVAIETAGVDRKEFGNYIFGEIDVPALETFESTIEPYDTSRSLQLNPMHPVCAMLIPFIGSKLEQVRLEQVRKLAEARKTEQARRLASEAEKIAEILNQDFRRMMSKLEGIRAVASHPGSAGARFGSTSSADDDEGIWAEGTAQPGDVDNATHRNPNPGPGPRPPRPAPNIETTGAPNQTRKRAVDPAAGTERRP